MQAGYDAQLKSVVMLKNKNNTLPITERKTVYIPEILTPSVLDWYGHWTRSSYKHPVNMELVKKYYNVTSNPEEADFAIVFVNSPWCNIQGGGFEMSDREAGGNRYVPISLQYGIYTAKNARTPSIAAGDPVIDPEIKDRSYNGKSVIASNYTDLNAILATKGQMGDKPVIVVANITRPMIFNEFEKHVDAIITRYSIGEQAVLDIISGKAEPSGLLPVQIPANMETVEAQLEDVPFDMDCHVDSEGNVYDFAFGMNWGGVIKDARTEKYNKINYISAQK
jgi:beta-glucosidase